jgi:hypothetical protein
MTFPAAAEEKKFLFLLSLCCVCEKGKIQQRIHPKDGKTMTTYLSGHCSFLPGGRGDSLACSVTAIIGTFSHKSSLPLSGT